jgi:predicted phage terminase large subunit-like protein
MPPRHAKTETVSVRIGVCWLLDNPTDNVLLTGYNERFARRLGRKARNIADRVLDMDRSKQSSDEWSTQQGGILMTRGVGSPPTGTGFNLIVIDDPIRSREDAESEVYREGLWDWYTDDLYTRSEPGGAIVAVATPWHEDEALERAVASEPDRWVVVKLPALAIEDDALGRSLGQALWPERYDEDSLIRIREVMAQNEGLRSWEALYQQNPTPREGIFFKVSQLQIVDSLPAGLMPGWRCWDMAATQGIGSAFTAGVKICGPDRNGIYYVADVVRGQWLTDERNDVMRQTAAIDGRTVRIRVPVDPGSAGVDTAKALVKALAGYTVKSERVTGSKESRADPFSSQVNAGNVRLLKAPWNAIYIEELRQFPAGKRKDQVDASADSFDELCQQRPMSAAAGGTARAPIVGYKPV